MGAFQYIECGFFVKDSAAPPCLAPLSTDNWGPHTVDGQNPA